MKNKLGISLIVLVITIIVMVILAGAILLSLSETGIFDKASEAVDVNDKKQIEHIALLAWAEAYVDGARNVKELQEAVDNALSAYNIDDKYIVRATENGVEPVYEVLSEEASVDYTKSINEGESAENYLINTGFYPAMLTWDTDEPASLKEVRFYIKDMTTENAEFIPTKVSIYPDTEGDLYTTISGGTVMASAATFALFHEVFDYDKVMLKTEYIYENNTIKYSCSHVIDTSGMPR